MSTLLLSLRAPMQAWGAQSRFTTRATGHEPTRSGVLGLLAAAQGRRRTDPIEDLVDLEFAVRVDQPGTLLRDFQTAQRWETGHRLPLTTRYYLSDAVFVAAVGGPQELLEGLAEALRAPVFPLFLGRRSCPAGPDLLIGTRYGSPEEALRAEPWRAADWYRRTQPTQVELPILRDARPGERGDAVRDVPVSFDPRHRQYAWREVVRAEPAVVGNSVGRSPEDPFLATVMGA